MKNYSTWVKWGFRLAVGLAFVFCIFSIVNMENLGNILLRCRFWPLLEAFALFFCATVPSSMAWKMLLKPLGYEMSLSYSVRVSIVGFFFNNVFPSGFLGDIYRIFAVKEVGIEKMPGAVSVFMERCAAFLALIVATAISFVITLPILQGIVAGSVLSNIWPALSNLRLDWLIGSMLAILACIFVLACCFIIYCGKDQTKGEKILKRFSFGLPVREFFSMASSYKEHKKAFFSATLVDVLSPVLEGLAFTSIAWSLGLEVSPILFLAFATVFRVVHHIPVSVNAVGTQEFAFVLFSAPLGINADEAVAISILVHAIKMFVSISGSLLYFCGKEKMADFAPKDNEQA